MIFRNEHQGSILPKFFIIFAMFVSVFASFQIMFFESEELFSILKPYKVDGDIQRRIFLMCCFTVYFIRLIVTLKFYQRKMFWTEALVIANIMPWILPYVAWVGGSKEDPIGMLEIFGIVLFIYGSYLNTASEYFRYVWKKRKKNQGRLYTLKLFKHTRHTNYAGDILLFTGLALVGNHLNLLFVPVSMTVFFAFVLIPLKEKYLASKYGEEFKEYAHNTKKLIPGIY